MTTELNVQDQLYKLFAANGDETIYTAVVEAIDDQVADGLIEQFFDRVNKAHDAAVTFTQTYATATTTVPAATANSVATTGSSNSSPYGFTTAAQADAIVTAVNALVADSLVNRKLTNALIDLLQAAGDCA